jgi:hypothetical protein
MGIETEKPGRTSIETRVKQQFPSLFITLVSVLVGLVFADLVSEARARMVLWPLTLETLRTWGQIAAMGASTLTAWVVYAHIGASRQRVPVLADSLVAFCTPIPLLIGNSLVGQRAIWPWFAFASCYLAVSLFASLWQIRLVRADEELTAAFSRRFLATGFFAIFLAGIPAFAAFAWIDYEGWMPLWLETLIAFSPVPAAALCMQLFFADWHRALKEADEAP